MDRLSLIFSCLVISLATVSSQDMLLNEPCKTMNKLEVKCITITSCSFAIDLLQMRDVKALRSMHCGFKDKNPMVCCPKLNNNNSMIIFNNSSETATNRPKKATTPFIEKETVLTTIVPEVIQSDIFPDRKTCGLVRAVDRIVGGMNTEIDEFPWLARIYYIHNARSVMESGFKCAASLITNRYLLTAAHCVRKSLKEIPLIVRLGDWDEQTERDCIDSYCNKPVDINVKKIIAYPNFTIENPTCGDIALLELEKPVEYTEFIQPVCLPTTEFVAQQDYITGSSYMAAGWGVTEYGSRSPIKRKVKLDAVSIDFCKRVHINIAESSLERIICAGGTQGKDTCSGDSGGSLTKEISENYQINWYLYGITSFGGKKCGTEGIPGIYTRITPYMEWIKNTISNQTRHE